MRILSFSLWLSCLYSSAIAFNGGVTFSTKVIRLRTFGVGPNVGSRFNSLSTDSKPQRSSTVRFAGGSSPAPFEPIGKERMAELIEEYESKGRVESGLVVIDVRGNDEIQQTGKLSDNTYTLPLPFIKDQGALAMDPEEFETLFGFPKPEMDETIVFTCKAGMRSNMAAQLAGMEGYSNIVSYQGGANEWFS